MRQVSWLPRILCAVALLSLPLPAQWNDDHRGDVPYVPTPPDVVEAMLNLAGVKAGDQVIDLGCGDGRIVVMAAEKFGAHATGVDINPVRIKEANDNARQAGVTGRVRFIEQSFFDADVHEATVVTLYLLSSINLKLRPKLLRELKPGTRIVSNTFDMGTWEPDQKKVVNGRTIYLWTVTNKAKMEFSK